MRQPLYRSLPLSLRFFAWARQALALVLATAMLARCTTLAALFSLLSSTSFAAETELPLPQAVEVMKSLEGSLRVVEWRFTTILGTYAPGGQEFVPDESPVKHEGWVVIEPSRGRYRADINAIMKWVQGAAPYQGMAASFSYDGTTYRDWNRTKPGPELPGPTDPARGDGYIAQAPVNEFERTWRISTGVYCCPSFFMAKRLSQHLEENAAAGKQQSVFVNDSRVWRVITVDEDGDRVEIEYDAKRGGAILGATWTEESPPVAFQRCTVQLEQIGDSWLPKRAEIVALLSKPVRVTRTEFSEQKANHAVAGDVFQTKFPVGMRVDDRIEQASFVVGPGLGAEQAAVREFMRNEGIEGPASAQEKRRPFSAGRVVLLVAGAVIAIFGGSLFIRRWLKSRHGLG